MTFQPWQGPGANPTDIPYGQVSNNPIIDIITQILGQNSQQLNNEQLERQAIAMMQNPVGQQAYIQRVPIGQGGGPRTGGEAFEDASVMYGSAPSGLPGDVKFPTQNLQQQFASRRATRAQRQANEDEYSRAQASLRDAAIARSQQGKQAQAQAMLQAVEGRRSRAAAAASAAEDKRRWELEYSQKEREIDAAIEQAKSKQEFEERLKMFDLELQRMGVAASQRSAKVAEKKFEWEKKQKEKEIDPLQGMTTSEDGLTPGTVYKFEDL